MTGLDTDSIGVGDVTPWGLLPQDERSQVLGLTGCDATSWGTLSVRPASSLGRPEVIVVGSQAILMEQAFAGSCGRYVRLRLIRLPCRSKVSATGA